MSGNIFDPNSYVTDSPEYAAAKKASIGPSRDPYSAQYAADKAAQMTPGTSAGDGGGTGQIGADLGRQYFNTDPQAYWSRIVARLGGPTSTLGAYAARRFGDAWSGYIQASTTNPLLKFADYVDQNYGAGQVGTQFQGTAPALRGQSYQWAAGRFLG